MSRSGGTSSLRGDTDGDAADCEMSDAGTGAVLARSGKMRRSPVSGQKGKTSSDVTEEGSENQLGGLGQLFTPKASNSGSQVVQEDLELNRTRLGVIKKKAEELLEFVKLKYKAQKKMISMVEAVKNGLMGVEREQQAWRVRAETAEKKLEKLENVPSDGYANPRGSKRDRDTPVEEEAPKKQKEGHGEKIDNEEKGEGWQKIKNKNEKKAEKMKSNEKKTEEKKKAEMKKQPRQRTKGDALIVEVKAGTTYADLLRKVRSDPELEELGKYVVKTRRTQKGEMLFELEKDPKVKSSAFKQLIEKSLGEEANVRALSQESVIECSNLDEITTVEELRSALKVQCGLGDEESMSIRLRKAYGGTQVAVIRISALLANKLLEKGKIKVGWSVCHIKAVPRVTKEMERCFKCMGFGHHARNCDGPDRSKLCRKCGEGGHFANDCARPAKCMLCKPQDGNGHVTGGFKCPEYKKAMANQQ